MYTDLHILYPIEKFSQNYFSYQNYNYLKKIWSDTKAIIKRHFQD